MSYFEEREKALLGEQAYQELYRYPPKTARGITVNTRVKSVQEFAQNTPFAVKPSPFCAAGFSIEEDCKAGRDPWHHAGIYYVQEPSAASAAPLLRVQPGDKVLDLCAAPGGKSAQLAAALQGEGVLFSNEYDSKRAGILLSNTERMGAPNVVVLNEEPSRIAGALPGYFDKILVDAPCSGEGMFRKEPEALRQHNEGLVKQCAALQADILDAAAVLLRPDGELVYSTCTFSPDEDEGSIGAFLQRHPEFELLPCGADFGCEGQKACCIHGEIDTALVRRIYPCHGGEGHFMARLHKKEGEEPAFKKQKNGKQPKVPELCAEFLKRYFPALCEKPLLAADTRVYLLPEVSLPDWKGLRLLRAGVLAGEIVKSRFEPHHHLFKAYGTLCVNREELTREDPRTAAFLRGEEIAAQTARDGFCTVLVDGVPLGFGKKSGSMIKNRYPKGLRNL